MNGKELIRHMEKDVKLREGNIFIAGSRKSNERELTLESGQMIDRMEYTMKTRAEILQLTRKESNKLFVSTGASNRLQNVLQALARQLIAMNSKLLNFNYIRTSVITHWLKIHILRQT
ncbi:MAG: hypothetical protein HC819_07495 [Cyclobacteriaceae bacterium]|nr:hypothetical protein [Cyclobacteriaceae bacterium]